MTETISQTRSLHDVREQAAGVHCGHCWAAPGESCDAAGTHLARLARARRRGLISEAEMAAVLEAAGDVFTNAAIVRDGAR